MHEILASKTPTDTNHTNQPILVTGAHRTGTTWVGKMLAAGGNAAFISEPLNLLHRPGVFIKPVKHWYPYICSDNESDYLVGLNQILNFQYHTLAEIKSLRSLKDLGRMVRDWSVFARGRLFHQRPLFKDPFAVFSSLWFADRLSFKVVITIRHPAAFVSSLKRLDWPFDLRDLLDQPLLLRDWLEPFKPEMELLSGHPGDPISSNSLLWKMVYSVVQMFRKQNPGVILVRHEDLSLCPIEEYQHLYRDLGLEFSTKARRAVLDSSGSENPAELSAGSAHAIRLDSQANLDNWKRRLTREEITRVRNLTEETASFYYSDLDWD
jgi:hypothetical protein